MRATDHSCAEPTPKHSGHCHTRKGFSTVTRRSAPASRGLDDEDDRLQHHRIRSGFGAQQHLRCATQQYADHRYFSPCS
ncbi:MAG: hypothetical protein RSD57_07950 [Comamonas sp.]